MTAQIIKFPEKKDNVRHWATTYLAMYKDQGQEACGAYARDIIPEQFHSQVDALVKEMSGEDK